MMYLRFKRNFKNYELKIVAEYQLINQKNFSLFSRALLKFTNLLILYVNGLVVNIVVLKSVFL